MKNLFFSLSLFIIMICAILFSTSFLIKTNDHLVDHIDHMVEVMGVDHIGLGFDFAEYLNADTLKHYASTYTYGVRGLEDTTKAKNIISVLEKRGYSKEDIEKICYKNFYRVIKEIIK